MKAAVIVSAIAASAVAAQPKASIRAQRFFESNTEASTKANLLLKFDTNTADRLEEVAAKAANPRQIVYDLLTEQAKKSEALLAPFLAPGQTFSSLYIAGGVSINSVSKSSFEALAKADFVKYIDLNTANDITYPEVVTGASDNGRSTEQAANEWGVETIGAPAIWKYTKGKGAVVGSIDSGALHTHEAIKDNWRSDYGWFDAANGTLAPHDPHGHGTHTIGTMVGTHGIGVAPEAKWISCGMGTAPTTDRLLKCGQFMLCPTKADGSAPDCSKGADVINNSWGATGAYNPWFEDVVKAWRAAQLIPIFSNGNSGPACSTTGSPGSYKNVISVGAIGSYTDENDKLAFFSSKGPVADNGAAYIKPDIAAPGFFTRSAGRANNTAYVQMGGTSMAAPHVAGVVALLRSFDRTLTYDAIYKYLTATTDQKELNTTEPAIWQLTNNRTLPGAPNCGGVSDSSWPNNRFGHGRLNVGTILRDGKLNDGRRPTC